MALDDCITKAMIVGAIKPHQAAKLRELVQQANDSEIRFLENFIQEKAEVKRRANLQVIATKRALDNINKHPGGPGRGLLSLLVRDPEGKAAWSNVDYRRHAILAELHGRFAEAMDRYRTKRLGWSQDTAGVKNMVKELFGESSGDADAAAFARMWTDAAETARLRFNVAGGNIPHRKDWGLPHAHDARKIAAAGLDEWRDFIVPRLDPRRMYDAGGQPLSKEKFDALIEGLYHRFEEQAGRTATDIDRHVPNAPDHRLLTFKDSASWLEYNYKFGHPDIYSALNTHLEHMAGDIALQEILGPHPDMTMRQLTEVAAKAGTNSFTMKLIRDSYQVVTARINQTEHEFLANLGTTVRNLLSSAQLGSAFISSFSDLWTQKITRTINGLPSVRMVGEIFSLMNPRNADDRLFAVKLGLGAEAWVTRALAASRFQEITGHGLSAKISDTVFRATLLSSWTDAGRKAFGMEFLGYLGENMQRGFGELPEALRNSMARYGLTEAHWKIIQQADVIERDGARYLDLKSIGLLARKESHQAADVFAEAAQYAAAQEKIEANVTTRQSGKAATRLRLQRQGAKAEQVMSRIELIRDASYKLHEMILSETDFAVPQPDALVRALVTQGQKRGSIMGELARSLALYKQFPATMVATHLLRGALTLEGLDKGRYLAELLIGLTVMGAISVQARNVLKGKDPQDMQDPGFWWQAFMQGGGAGIFGDFVQASESRFGHGFTTTLGGPVVGLIDDSVNLTMGNLHQFIAGKETNFAREAVNFAHRYTPGSNAWYARLAMERLIWDRLRELADPNAAQSFRRIQQRARKDYAQEFWWRPGDPLPQRAPDLGAAR